MAMEKQQIFPVAGDSLYYIVEREHVVITGWSGLSSELEIPGCIAGRPVTGIGKKAFLSKKNLRQISLPDTLEEVGDWAFAYCDNLERAELPERKLSFGKTVFLECRKLRFLRVRRKGEAVAALLAAAVTMCDAYYLLDTQEAGNGEWLEKWDARMLSVLQEADSEGYSRQVLCGEEDYGSTDLNAYLSRKRKGKVRLLLLRLLYADGLSQKVREEMEHYLLSHTKGCESEETWQVILAEHGEDRAYYELFARLGCLREENLEGILRDIGEAYPEMKAYFLRYREQRLGYQDFFAGLEL
ncbi:MAG: leucine-rich repeat domain-containing protein [Roseburia sp.]|nr:leucine-rich repeat domain-containing protein [Roseburia sp.]